MALKLLAQRTQSLALEKPGSPRNHLRLLDSFKFFTIYFASLLHNYASAKALSNDKQSVLKRKPFSPQKRTPYDFGRVGHGG